MLVCAGSSPTSSVARQPVTWSSRSCPAFAAAPVRPVRTERMPFSAERVRPCLERHPRSLVLGNGCRIGCDVNRTDVLVRAGQLAAEGVPFVLATVVAVERVGPARRGDRARSSLPTERLSAGRRCLLRADRRPRGAPCSRRRRDAPPPHRPMASVRPRVPIPRLSSPRRAARPRASSRSCGCSWRSRCSRSGARAPRPRHSHGSRRRRGGG